jgi:glycerophosphoryl diester phosphodiesterase
MESTFRPKDLTLFGEVKRVLDESDTQARGTKVTIECFEFAVLREAKWRIGDSATYVFLSAPDTLPRGYEVLGDDLLAEIAENFEGLSVHYSMILDSDLVKRARAKNLVMYTYTARVETAEGEVKDWFNRLSQTGVDGIFCDQPDLMVNIVRGSK